MPRCLLPRLPAQPVWLPWGEFLARLREEHPDLEALREATTKLVVGLPVTRILEVAEKSDAQLMVVGSQGLTGLPRLLLGSKAERLAQLSPIPVTIVKAGTKAAGKKAEKD